MSQVSILFAAEIPNGRNRARSVPARAARRFAASLHYISKSAPPRTVGIELQVETVHTRKRL